MFKLLWIRVPYYKSVSLIRRIADGVILNTMLLGVGYLPCIKTIKYIHGKARVVPKSKYSMCGIAETICFGYCNENDYRG